MISRSRTLATCMLFGAALLLASAWTARSWQGTVYVYVGEVRAPASVRQARDYQAVDRQVFAREPDAQLMTGARLLARREDVGLSLGHPLLKKIGGGREFACAINGKPGAFDRLEVIFYGTGITDSGERPELVVDTDCRAADQIDALETLWIPAKAIFMRPPSDGDFEIAGPQDLRVSLQHIPDAWPDSWVLWSVRFYRSDGNDAGLLVDAAHLRAQAVALPAFTTR